MKHYFLVLLLFGSFISPAQTRTEIAAYNIGLGALGGGIGAVINKKPGQKTGKVFLKGLWQGALGGYLVYESKNIVARIAEEEKLVYSWPAKFVNAAGTSIIENAAANRDFWERWHLHIGFNRIEIYTKDKFRVKYKIMPVSLIITAESVFSTKFEFDYTLQTGEFIFSKNDIIASRGSVAYANGSRTIVFDSSQLNNYEAFAHEIIHVYQYHDYNFLNVYPNKLYTKWEKSSKTFKKIYSLFYFDIQGPFLGSLYLLEEADQKYDNFFEYEAQFFATQGDFFNVD